MFKKIFEDWLNNDFDDIDVRKDMINTVEDSPYHREPNVWVHTHMVVNQYVDMAPDVWSTSDLMGALMCAFHDTGKPMSEETLERSDGTEYRRYTNHDVYSGNLFIDYVCKNRNHPVFENLSDIDLYNIWVMIAYHMPYKLNKDRVEVLHNHMNHYGLVDVFTRGVYADAKGRVADDQEKTESASLGWCDNFKSIVSSAHCIPDSSRWLTLLCGCSGIGKSTYANTILKLYGDNAAYHSMDQLRLELYSSDYSEAFKMSTEDNAFGNKVTQDFNKKLKSHVCTVVDNTNLSWKRRKQYLNVKGDHIKTAVVFVADFDTVVGRQKARTDKFIPEHAVRNMFFSHRPVILGEVDEIVIKGLDE